MDKWSHTLVSNSEWSELVAIYMHSDRHRLWYDSGHADGRQEALGRVDKRDSSGSRPMIQAHLYVGDELGTQPDIRR